MKLQLSSDQLDSFFTKSFGNYQDLIKFSDFSKIVNKRHRITDRMGNESKKRGEVFDGIF